MARTTNQLLYQAIRIEGGLIPADELARLHGLTRDELRYILDLADAPFGHSGALLGPDYPSEIFRGLKSKEERAHGEYRTRRLILAAWDALNSAN